ncbi:DUF5133 domain-containing protein [Streptomyces sp. NPDC001351]|uniref:DUF5133 domain-containing protein n=1 Tax=Streptomyces sp. NPDC001351 TaxID=3364564 RepID=UPI0036B1DD35
MLMPHVRTVAAALHAYRSAWTGVLRDPACPLSYRRLDDAAYTLSVLMGQRNAADAVAEAESLLASASAGERRRRAGQVRPPSADVDSESAADGSVSWHAGIQAVPQTPPLASSRGPHPRSRKHASMGRMRYREDHHDAP